MSRFSYFLVTHGSRNPSDFLPNLVKLVQQKCQDLCGGGSLEAQDLSLSSQLSNFAKIAGKQDYTQILVVPVFLINGVHVVSDIPEQVAQAQKFCAQKLQIAEHFGTYPQILARLQAKFLETSATKILLSHGSSRSEAMAYLNNLAQNLQAIPAFWAVDPSLETQIEALIKLSHKEIAIMPYFLGSDSIIKAINAKISAFNSQNQVTQNLVTKNQIQIKLLKMPFEPEEIANLIVEYLQKKYDK